ncbi:MAG: hypothetical protein ACOC6C_00115 [Verrucomicrobiota bacterium]
MKATLGIILGLGYITAVVYILVRTNKAKTQQYREAGGYIRQYQLLGKGVQHLLRNKLIVVLLIIVTGLIVASLIAGLFYTSS